MVAQNKKNQLDSVTSFLKDSPSFSLLKFDNTSHAALEKLRKNLKKADSKLLVVKNTILQKAINKLASDKETSYLKDIQKKTKNIKENTAILGLSSDWSKGLQAFHEYTKSEKTVTFKVGCLDTKTYEEAELKQIAQLPGKDILVGKLISGMKSPTAHFVHTLKFNMQKFVYILNAKSKQN